MSQTIANTPPPTTTTLQLESVKIGWDIGIKNMSYCQLQKITNPESIDANPHIKNIIKLGTNYYHIPAWDVINIVPKVNELQNTDGEIMLIGRPNVLCKHATGANICNKKATVCKVTGRAVDGGYFGYCAPHLKKSGMGPRDTVEVKTGACSCWHFDTQSNARCTGKVTVISSDNHFIGYCKKHIPSPPSAGSPLAGIYLTVVKNKKTTSMDLTTLASALYDELDARMHILAASDVLLENQPVLKNPTMKTMQTFLYSYYIIHGVQKSKLVKNIQCYCASKKLDIIKLLPSTRAKQIVDAITAVKAQYSRNKKMAVMLCEYLLEIGIRCDDVRNKFKDKKKQDDLADSLLMTLHYNERPTLAELSKRHASKRTILTTEEQSLINGILGITGSKKTKEKLNNAAATAANNTLTNSLTATDITTLMGMADLHIDLDIIPDSSEESDSLDS